MTLGRSAAEMKAGSGGSQMRPYENLHKRVVLGVNGWVNIPYIDNEHLGIYNRDPNGLS